ncbi:MAG: aminotransferase class IV [Candidatus Omnitrophica bacterium]|nr:aminotransferase class IV [Candidatus Omnitrophota bacterium]
MKRLSEAASRQPLSDLTHPAGEVFETLRMYEGRVFRAEEHVDRLYESARTGGVRTRLARSRVKAQLSRFAGDCGRRNGLVRIMLGEKGLKLVSVPGRRYSPNCYKRGVCLRTSVMKRSGARFLLSRMKSKDCLTGVMASSERSSKDIFDTLLLTNEGHVGEGTTSNVFIVKGGVIVTPPLWEGILDGVTRRAVMELASREGLKVREDVLLRHDLYNADEGFLTNTSMEIMPVSYVDGRRIGRAAPGPVTRRLRHAFKSVVASL